MLRYTSTNYTCMAHTDTTSKCMHSYPGCQESRAQSAAKIAEQKVSAPSQPSKPSPAAYLAPHFPRNIVHACVCARAYACVRACTHAHCLWCVRACTCVCVCVCLSLCLCCVVLCFVSSQKIGQIRRKTEKMIKAAIRKVCIIFKMITIFYRPADVRLPSELRVCDSCV